MTIFVKTSWMVMMQGVFDMSEYRSPYDREIIKKQAKGAAELKRACPVCGRPKTHHTYEQVKQCKSSTEVENRVSRMTPKEIQDSAQKKL